jgi:hypothetical protein
MSVIGCELAGMEIVSPVELRLGMAMYNIFAETEQILIRSILRRFAA